MSGRAAERIVTDMDEHSPMKGHARQWIREALDMSDNRTERHIAGYIKRKFDETYGPTWHCIVGADFKAQFSHESKSFIFVSIGKTNVLLFKTM